MRHPWGDGEMGCGTPAEGAGGSVRTTMSYARDPSLRLKNGSGRDDSRPGGKGASLFADLTSESLPCHEKRDKGGAPAQSRLMAKPGMRVSPLARVSGGGQR